MLAAMTLFVIACWAAVFDSTAGFSTNGFGEHYPGGYGLGAVLMCETVLTFIFLMVILGATDRRAPAGFAPIFIGLGLTLIHLIAIPVDNLSVNSARSTGPALIGGNWAVGQLRAFCVAPIFGTILDGTVYRRVFEADSPGSQCILRQGTVLRGEILKTSTTLNERSEEDRRRRRLCWKRCRRPSAKRS